MIDIEERLTEGVNAERLRAEGKRAFKPSLVFGAGVVVAVVIVVYLVLHISQTFGHKTETVRFAAPTAFGIFEGFDDVRYRGVPAGTIEKIERHGTQIVLVAKVRKSFGPIFKDARTQLRPITPLNDEYLDIVDQGTERAGVAEPAQPLPSRQMQVSVSGPEVLDGLTADERKSFSILLDQLGNGMSDRGVALRQAFQQVAPFLDGAGKLTQQIDVRQQATKHLIHNVSELTAELGSRQTQLRRLVSSGSKTLGALQQGAPDLDGTLRELGPTFTTLQSSLTTVDGVVHDVNGGLKSAVPLADALPTGLKAAQRLSDDLSPTLKSLRGPGGKGFATWLTELTKTFDDGGNAFGALRPQVPVLNRTVKDADSCEKGVISFFQWDASILKYGDNHGPVPRGNIVFGVPSTGAEAQQRPFNNGCAPGAPARGQLTAKDLH